VPNLILDPSVAENPILWFLGWMTYLALVTCFIVDGLLPQAQMFFTGGSTPIKARFRILLLVLAIVAVLVTKRLRKSPISNAHIVLAVFLCVDFVILYATTGYYALDIFNSFRVILIPIILFGVILSSPLNLTQPAVLAGGAVVFLASLTISALQYITDTSVLPTRSQNGTFAVPAYTFFGHPRAFSLFGSALDAGLFYCIPVALGDILLLMRRRLLIGSLLLSLSIFGLYTTFTRLAFLGLAATLFSALMLWTRRLPRVAKVLPFIWILIAIATISIAARDSGGSSRRDISSTATLYERFVGWRYYAEKYMSEDLTEMLFGTGMSEYAASDAPNWSPSAAPVPIDDAFLQLLLNSGLISLGIVIYYYIKAWNSLYFKANRERDPFVLAAAAVFSTTPLFAVINDLPVQMFALYTIAMMITHKNSYTQTMNTSGQLGEHPAVAGTVP
jgi:hypothetical protein